MRVPYGWFARAEGTAVERAAHDLTAYLGRAQQAAVPSTDYRLHMAHGDASPVSPGAAGAVELWSPNGTPPSGEAAADPCDSESSNRGREGETGARCAEEPDCLPTDTPCRSTQAPERRVTP